VHLCGNDLTLPPAQRWTVALAGYRAERPRLAQ